MAKESMKARERKRQRLVARYAEKRAALKEAGEWDALQKLPKNSLVPDFVTALILQALKPPYCASKGASSTDT